MNHPPRRRDRGIALLLVLLVLTILIILVSQLVLATSHNRSVADNAVSDLQNSYGVKSAYTVALQYLTNDAEKAADVDALDESWAGSIPVQLAASTVTVKIEDCERKINLCALVNDQGAENPKVTAQLTRLLKVLNHDPETAKRILDYQDKDLKGDYESGARNDRMYNLDEIMRIDGIPKEALFGDDFRKGILSYLTAWPRSGAPAGKPAVPFGKININTAPVEVLQALDDEIDSTIAQAIVDYRSKAGATPGSTQHFSKADDLKSVSGMTDKILARIKDQVSVKSSAFEIHAKSSTGAIEKKWLYVVARGSAAAASPSPNPSGTPTPPPPPPTPSGTPSPSPSGSPAAGGGFTLLASGPESDFLSIKKPKEKEE